MSDSTERLAVMHAVKKAIVFREPEPEKTQEAAAPVDIAEPSDIPVSSDAAEPPGPFDIPEDIPAEAPKKRKTKKAAKKQISDEASTLSFE